MPRGKTQPCSKCGTMQGSPTGLCDTCRGKSPQTETPKRRGRGKAKGTEPEVSYTSPPSHPRINPDPLDIRVGDRIVYRGEDGVERGEVKAVSFVKTTQYILAALDGKTNPALIDLSQEVRDKLKVEKRVQEAT